MAKKHLHAAMAEAQEAQSRDEGSNQMVEIVVPLVAPRGGFFPRNFDLELTPTQHRTLARISAGFSVDRKQPLGANETVQYLLDVIAAESQTEV